MIGKVSDEVKWQMNKQILHFSFGITCLSTSLMKLEILVEIFERNLALFVCPNPPAIPACTEHRTWLRQFQLDPGISRTTMQQKCTSKFPLAFQVQVITGRWGMASKCLKERLQALFTLKSFLVFFFLSSLQPKFVSDAGLFHRLSLALPVGLAFVQSVFELPVFALSCRL